MYFLIHHSRGLLMLNASNRQDVDYWSQRQFGQESRRVCIMEVDEMDTANWVERSGTGCLRGPSGCTPRLSIMADAVQRIAGTDQERLNGSDWYRQNDVRSRASVVH